MEHVNYIEHVNQLKTSFTVTLDSLRYQDQPS